MTSVPQPQAQEKLWAVNVVKIIPCQNAGNLRALATVKIGPLVIHGCRLIQQTNQAPWVSMPQRQDDSGRWFPIVATEDQDLRDAVKGAVLQAWDAWRIFRVGGGEQ